MKYPRNTDLDPQLVWRGKDEQDWSDLVVYAPPLYIQEKVHPKVLIDDLLRQTKEAQAGAPGAQADLFADFNGITVGVDRTEFYQHDQNWSNRMILGDSLQVMASLAGRTCRSRRYDTWPLSGLTAASWCVQTPLLITCRSASRSRAPYCRRGRRASRAWPLAVAKTLPAAARALSDCDLVHCLMEPVVSKNTNELKTGAPGRFDRHRPDLGRVGCDVGDSGSPYAQGKHHPATGCHASRAETWI